MHAIELMLINYPTKFYNSKLCVKVICTSYDIPKIESYAGTFCFRKWKFPKRKNGWRGGLLATGRWLAVPHVYVASETREGITMPHQLYYVVEYINPGVPNTSAT
jgi:hypothetical protein